MLSSGITLSGLLSRPGNPLWAESIFEASWIGYRKMIFDVTKVTYNTYSCAMSGMSREMMTMDGRDSAECQNWEKKDIVGINGKV